jgi:hypothetical protein
MGRRSLHQAMGTEVQVLTAEYLRKIAAARHSTAEKLGATPTGFLADASEKVAAPGALAANSDHAMLSISFPGVGRAFHEVKITPKQAKFLAIPVHAIAYGKRARFLWDSLKLFIPKGSRFICMRMRDGKTLLRLYVLVRSVTQPQDRTLLPSQEEWVEAAGLGARNWFHNQLEGVTA